MYKGKAGKAGAIAIGLAAMAAVIAWRFAAPVPADTPKNITLVYVGANNCAPCDVWQRKHGNAFRTSDEFNRLSYREVKSPSLLDVLKDEHWPEDLRPYRQAIGRHAGVPLWLVIADDQLVLQGFGAGQWIEAVLPKVKSLLQ